MKANIREGILKALQTKLPDPDRPGQSTRPAYTVHALARKIGLNPSRVESELRSLVRAGKVVTRTTKANDVLYKLADKNDGRWAADNGLHIPRRRTLGGRHIHITGWF